MKHLLPTILLMAAFTSKAQPSLKIGASLNTYENNITMTHVLPAAGIHWKFGDFHIEGLYAMRGANYGTYDGSNMYTFRTDYVVLDASVDVIHLHGLTINLAAHGDYLVHTGAYSMYNEGNTSWKVDGWIANRWDFGPRAGANWQLSPVLSIGADYSYGLNRVGKYKWAPLYECHNTNLLVYLQFTIPHK